MVKEMTKIREIIDSCIYEPIKDNCGYKLINNETIDILEKELNEYMDEFTGWLKDKENAPIEENK